ncbi:segregation/condensation protein A [soil metagenome]
MSYRVALDSFHGPLDLLLTLVKRNEVDIHNIPINRIAGQFLEYLTVIELLDVEGAGDFIVMAATLMEIKSRSLLPVEVQADEADEPDPRRELVKQLLEYRKFKDAAAALEGRAEAHAVKLPRTDEDDAVAGEAPLKPVELWDLVSAFARLMRETQALQARTITIDDTPQEVYERQIVAKASETGSIAFRDLFTPPYYKAKLIGLFLAILELIKRGEITLEQPVEFGDILIRMPQLAQL